MRRLHSALVMTAAAGLFILAPQNSTCAADNYTVDGVHSSVSFKIQHIGLTWIHGRFNEFSGGFTLDKEDPRGRRSS